MLKRLKLIVISGVLLTAGVSAYVAAPFWTAWTIREAIKINDAPYLETKIEWLTVRATLKESLIAMAGSGRNGTILSPEPASIWQQVKSYLSKGAVERFVDATVTPTGMAGLFSMRKTYRPAASAEQKERLSNWQRMAAVWSRVSRAEFKGLRRFEMDMSDHLAPGRTISCVLELRGLVWKMTELRVFPTGGSATPVGFTEVL